MKKIIHKYADTPEGEWVTINGRHIFIGKGESLQDALAKSKPSPGKEGPSKIKGKTPSSIPEQGLHVKGTRAEATAKRVKAALTKAGFVRESGSVEGSESVTRDRDVYIHPTTKERVSVTMGWGVTKAGNSVSANRISKE